MYSGPGNHPYGMRIAIGKATRGASGSACPSYGPGLGPRRSMRAPLTSYSGEGLSGLEWTRLPAAISIGDIIANGSYSVIQAKALNQLQLG